MSEFDLISMGDRIYSIRNTRKMKQIDACTQLGISQSLYSKIETGKIDATISTIHKISKIFNVPISWIVGESSITAGLTDDERLEVVQFIKYVKSKRMQ